jgi:hypothetical protein
MSSAEPIVITTKDVMQLNKEAKQRAPTQKQPRRTKKKDDVKDSKGHESDEGNELLYLELNFELMVFSRKRR